MNNKSSDSVIPMDGSPIVSNNHMLSRGTEKLNFQGNLNLSEIKLRGILDKICSTLQYYGMVHMEKYPGLGLDLESSCKEVLADLDKFDLDRLIKIVDCQKNLQGVRQGIDQINQSTSIEVKKVKKEFEGDGSIYLEEYTLRCSQIEEHKSRGMAELHEIQADLIQKLGELGDISSHANVFDDIISRATILRRQYRRFFRNQELIIEQQLKSISPTVSIKMDPPPKEDIIFDDIVSIVDSNLGNHAGININRGIAGLLTKSLRKTNPEIFTQKIIQIPTRDTQERVARLLSYLQENPPPSR